MTIDWTGSRRGRYRFARVDHGSRAEVASIDTVLPGGSISSNINTSLKVSGLLDAVGPLAIGDDLVRIYYVAETADDMVEIPLATMYAAAEESILGSAVSRASLTLYSALLPVEQRALRSSVVIPAGTNIIGKVADLCLSCGVPIVVTPSTRTLTTSIVFGPDEESGESYLGMINYLLGIAGYWSLGVDAWGRAVAEPYENPASRAIAYEFTAGADAVFLPEMHLTTDAFFVPNVCVVTASVVDGPPVVGYYVNADPRSPFSTVSRRGIEIAVRDTVSEGTVAELNAIARRRLMEATAATETVDVQHPYLPDVQLGRAVSVEWPERGVFMRGVVQSQEIELSPACRTTSTIKRLV